MCLLPIVVAGFFLLCWMLRLCRRDESSTCAVKYIKFFRRFLLENRGRGPFAEETELEALLPGDFILLNGGSYYYHALIVVGRSGEMPLVAAHTYDAYMRPLSAYPYATLSPLHILGARD